MLRRFICLLISLVATFSFTACFKKNRTEQPVITGFSCDVDVKYQDMNVKGHLTRDSAGTLILDIEEPETIKGLSMHWNGETISLKLYGLSFDVNPETVPQSALGKSLLSVLDAAIGNQDGGEITEDGLMTKGTTVSGEFEILSDPQTGKLLMIRMPSNGLSAEFSNFLLSSEGKA